MALPKQRRLKSQVTDAHGLPDLARRIRQGVLTDCEDARMRTLAAAVIRKHNVPSRQPRKLARAFQLFAQRSVKFFREFPEINAAPWVTAKWGIGDCDDKARLIAALCKSFRIPVRLVFVTFYSPRRGVMSHVWPEAQVDKSGKWRALESVRPWPLGKSPLTNIRKRGYRYRVFALEI